MPPRIPQSVRESQLTELPGMTFHGFRGEYVGNKTMAAMSCHTCGHEWDAAVVNLISKGCGCAPCALAGRASRQTVSEESQIDKMTPLAAGRYSFARIGDYVGNRTMYRCTCLVDGHEWDAQMANLLSGKGCRHCADRLIGEKLTIPEEEQLERLSGSTFSMSRIGNYIGKETRYSCACLVDGREWEASLANLLRGHACPDCASHGFNQSKPGSLYVLVSHCGLAVKVGISNKPDQRLKRLTKVTPFSWHQVAQVDSQDGAQIAQWEKEIHSRHERAFDHSDFDGATEWLKTDRLTEILDDVTQMTAEAA